MSLRDQEIEDEKHLRSWLLDPIGHRQHWKANPGPDTVEFFGQQVPVVRQESLLADDDWVCDYCSGRINLSHEVDGETVPMWVPMHGSNALCGDCVANNLTSEEHRQIGREGFNPMIWSDKTCGCPPCSKVYLEIMRRLGETPERAT